MLLLLHIFYFIDLLCVILNHCYSFLQLSINDANMLFTQLFLTLFLQLSLTLIHSIFSYVPCLFFLIFLSFFLSHFYSFIHSLINLFIIDQFLQIHSFFIAVYFYTYSAILQDILTTLATISDFMRDVVCGILFRDTEALMLRYLHKTRKVRARYLCSSYI